jgi:hypothetical protein
MSTFVTLAVSMHSGGVTGARRASAGTRRSSSESICRTAASSQIGTRGSIRSLSQTISSLTARCGSSGNARNRSVTTRAAPTSVTDDFAAAASGEWEGHKVYFDEHGVPVQIPDKYMPPAFKEWGQVLVDWQSQCAMKVTVDTGLYARELRFIPTAGCEADSSTVETKWDRVVDVGNISPATAACSSIALGSYSAGPSDLSAKGATSSDATDFDILTIEHCLAFEDKPKPKKNETEAKRARVRVQQHLQFDADTKEFALKKLTAWKEFFYEPFNNAASLCASCGGPNKWGEFSVLPIETFVEGEWVGDVWGGFGDENVVLLPSGIYSKVTTTEKNELVLEAGWFVSDRDASYQPPCREVETHLVSTRVYVASGALSDVSFAKRERRVAR